MKSTGAILLLVLLHYVINKCGFHEKRHSFEHHKINLSPSSNLRQLQNITYQPIRIGVDYSTVDSDSTASSLNKLCLKAIVTRVVNSLQSILSIIPLSSPLIIQNCDPSIKINSTIASVGINSDIILFPFFDYKVNSSADAYAVQCVQDTVSGRPLAGLVGITSQYLDFSRNNWLDYYSNLVLHELTHVLVFNSELFPYFTNPNTGLKYNSNEITNTVFINGINRTVLVTPQVKKAVRAHYNCSSAYGAELENDGDSFSAGSHWESRTMLGDYMVAQDYDEVTISDITMALFEDSGWYRVNYYSGGLFKNGKNMGCNFLYTLCINHQTTEFPNDFCTSSNIQGCLAGRTGKGFCELTPSSSDLPSQYQYWIDPKLGGNKYADRCPVLSSVKTSNYFFSQNCGSGDSITLNLSRKEQYKNNSFCFDTSSSQNTNDHIPVCLPISCNNTLSITVGSTVVDCPYLGGRLSIENIDGFIVCPPYNWLCTGSITCNSLFECIDSKSVSTLSKEIICK